MKAGVAAGEEEREMEAGKKRQKEGDIKSANGKVEVYDVDADGEEPEDVVELDDDDDGNVEGDEDDDDDEEEDGGDDDEEGGGDDDDDDDVEEVTPHGFHPQAQAVDEDNDEEEEEEEGGEEGGGGGDDDDESDDDDGEGEEEEVYFSLLSCLPLINGWISVQCFRLLTMPAVFVQLFSDLERLLFCANLAVILFD